MLHIRWRMCVAHQPTDHTQVGRRSDAVCDHKGCDPSATRKARQVGLPW